LKKDISGKYIASPVFSLTTRRWPDNVVEESPRWCSVDLRDGNQSLPLPMSIEQKKKFFNMLLEIGFKEIEVGFPSASQIEFDFIRELVDNKMIPDDVTVQVMVQSREHLIKRTFEAIKGVKNVIVHLYNSTSEVQRRIVFGKSKQEIIDIALDGVKLIRKYADEFEGKLTLQYSPESFTSTEIEYALCICNTVVEAWSPSSSREMIINLPSTLETTMPNRFADRIEWMNERLVKNKNIILSVHTHNDRGTGVASAEAAVLAGAKRVEGTILGNGERTGNLDILTMALNMTRDGIETGLDFSDSDKIVEMVEECTQIATHPRHPYVGELVYTAFSGSHQDAINKGLAYRKSNASKIWEVPYLPIDPADIGRSYEGIIQINSQSGKGGIAYTLSKEGYTLPKLYHPLVAKVIQKESEDVGAIVSPERIVEIFEKVFVNTASSILYVNNYRKHKTDSTQIQLDISVKGVKKQLQAEHPDGPLSAAVKALCEYIEKPCKILHYDEHMRTTTEGVEAVAYVTLVIENKESFGVGRDRDIVTASLKAVISALNN